MDLVPRFDRLAELPCQIDRIQHCWPTCASLGMPPSGRLLALAVARFGVIGPMRASVGANTPGSGTKARAGESTVSVASRIS
jgi:hypothetical protein